MIEITYTQEELVPLFAEAERRQKGDKRKDKWGRGYAKNPHLTGLIAEMCFGKWIGKPIDLTPNHDPGYGYAIGGDRIDVKGTDTPGMRGMPAILETNLNTEYLYVFAEVNQGRRLTWLKGCQYGLWLKANCQLTRLPSGMSYHPREVHLMPMEYILGVEA